VATSSRSPVSSVPSGIVRVKSPSSHETLDANCPMRTRIPSTSSTHCSTCPASGSWWQQLFSTLDKRDLDAGAGHDLGHFGADGAATKNHHGRWQFLGFDDLVVDSERRIG